MSTIKKEERIFVAGHSGLVGSAILKILKRKKKKVFIISKNKLNLTDYKKVFLFLKKKKN